MKGHEINHAQALHEINISDSLFLRSGHNNISLSTAHCRAVSHLYGEAHVENRQVNEDMGKVEAHGEDREECGNDDESVIHARLQPVVEHRHKIYRGDDNSDERGDGRHDDGELQVLDVSTGPDSAHIGTLKLRQRVNDAEPDDKPCGRHQSQEHSHKALCTHSSNLCETYQHHGDKEERGIVEEATRTYCGKGEIDAVFENAAFNLGENEISDVIETEYGYHVIKCISTFNREVTDANKIRIVQERRGKAFSEVYDNYVAGLTKNINTELWDDMTFIHNDNVTTCDFFEVFDRIWNS